MVLYISYVCLVSMVIILIYKFFSIKYKLKFYFFLFLFFPNNDNKIVLRLLIW